MIRYANKNDFDLLKSYDKHISTYELKNSINMERILIISDNDNFIGWLRFNMFWDNTPFMNMLYITQDNRNKGFGSKLVSFWEHEMLNNGFNIVLTSTLSNEKAQFFYRKNGYIDCGSLLLPNEPLEIILLKKLTNTAKNAIISSK